MAKTCKKCGKKIGMFEVSQFDGQGEIICKECSEKNKSEQEQMQQQKDEIEYKTRLARALTNNSQWEYRILNSNPQDERTINQLGSEGWQLVAAVPINSAALAPEQNPPSQPNPEQKPPEQNQQQPLQPQPAPTEVSYIFKRKL